LQSHPQDYAALSVSYRIRKPNISIFRQFLSSALSISNTESKHSPNRPTGNVKQLGRLSAFASGLRGNKAALAAWQWTVSAKGGLGKRIYIVGRGWTNYLPPQSITPLYSGSGQDMLSGPAWPALLGPPSLWPNSPVVAGL
jgi:hypothetical protein